MKTLVVIDMQNDFITGPLGTPEAQAIVPKVRAKIEEYKQHMDYIFYTKDTHYANYLETSEGKKLPVEHCIVDTCGFNIEDSLYDGYYPMGEIINKETFGYHDWGSYALEKDESIEIVGVCTDICVVSNALILKANFPESNIIVDASCCAGTTPENHKAALQVMKSCQINVIGE